MPENLKTLDDAIEAYALAGMEPSAIKLRLQLDRAEAKKRTAASNGAEPFDPSWNDLDTEGFDKVLKDVVPAFRTPKGGVNLTPPMPQDLQQFSQERSLSPAQRTQGSIADTAKRIFQVGAPVAVAAARPGGIPGKILEGGVGAGLNLMRLLGGDPPDDLTQTAAGNEMNALMGRAGSTIEKGIAPAFGKQGADILQNALSGALTAGAPSAVQGDPEFLGGSGVSLRAPSPGAMVGGAALSTAGSIGRLLLRSGNRTSGIRQAERIDEALTGTKPVVDETGARSLQGGKLLGRIARSANSEVSDQLAQRAEYGAVKAQYEKAKRLADAVDLPERKGLGGLVDSLKATRDTVRLETQMRKLEDAMIKNPKAIPEEALRAIASDPKKAEGFITKAMDALYSGTSRQGGIDDAMDNVVEMGKTIKTVTGGDPKTAVNAMMGYMFKRLNAGNISGAERFSERIKHTMKGMMVGMGVEPKAAKGATDTFLAMSDAMHRLGDGKPTALIGARTSKDGGVMLFLRDAAWYVAPSHFTDAILSGEGAGMKTFKTTHPEIYKALPQYLRRLERDPATTGQTWSQVTAALGQFLAQSGWQRIDPKAIPGAEAPQGGAMTPQGEPPLDFGIR